MSVGELLIIGGAEKKCPQGDVLHLFVDLAKGRSGAIGIIPTASEIPEEVCEDYIRTFHQLGVKDIDILSITNRAEADSPQIRTRIESLAAVFITGGDQSRLASIIRGTVLHDALMETWRDGLILGGTSAGASIMAHQMIVAADTKLDDDKLKVKLGAGFGFLDKIIIDQHFSQRGRFDRLLSAIAENKDIIGIGIDENTAILVKNDQFKVYGEHQVLVIDGRNSDFIEIIASENGSEELTISNFILHTLTKGYNFDLVNRQLIKKGKKK
ncbi:MULTISPECIES: cyanophycinase [Bacillaceae]|uniref:Cyanophycinase n=1 Tax=Peribacillus huizhouensis TaxID=1501239 RepID=A0ABR6CJ91_9BACI|nr:MULTISPECIES: cyanophycinase [Bacillaceae]MBA9025090.1 cyanophycinase [Peribacillus huizhouensis]